MGASPLISLGMRAMTANYAALQATGNNIANANTDGYSRQSVQLETSKSQFTGSGFFGKGVTVTTVSRTTNEFYTREASIARSIAAADATRAQQLGQLEKVFQTGESGLGHAATQLFNAFVDVTNQPQDISARQVVLSKAQELSSRYRTAAGQIDALQSGVTQDFRIGVTAINDLARQIASLNNSIALAQGAGHAPNDLLDKRDLAIAKLSESLQVSTIAADDGSVSVFFGGGQRLVLGADSTTLVAMNDIYDRSKVQLGVREGGVDRALPNETISGGSLAGLLRVQNDDITTARNLLGQMALAITGGLNQRQGLGWDLSGLFGGDILSAGEPRVLAATTNSGTGVVGLQIDDASLVQAADYELVYQGGGNYLLTRPSGQAAPLPLTLTAAQLAPPGFDRLDGIRISLDAGTPVAGDRFLLQPVSAAARDMKRVLDDPRGIAAASPVTGGLGAGNTGTASISTLQVVSATDPALAASISFTDNAGAYQLTLTDTSVQPPTTTVTTGTWTPNQPIAANGWALTLAGVPRANDTVNVSRTEFAANNNGNANSLLALRDARLVGGIRDGNGITAPSAGDAVRLAVTANDAYAITLAEVGVRTQSAALAADQSATLKAEAMARQTGVSGVNLDEEAARLIQYQQSYQAAAKMLQVAQSLFDTLLQATGR